MGSVRQSVGLVSSDSRPLLLESTGNEDPFSTIFSASGKVMCRRVKQKKALWIHKKRRISGEVIIHAWLRWRRTRYASTDANWRWCNMEGLVAVALLFCHKPQKM